MTDTATINLPSSTSVDEILANKTSDGVNDVVRMPVPAFIAQLVTPELAGTINGSEVAFTDDFTVLAAHTRKTLVANKATAIQATLTSASSYGAWFQFRLFNVNDGGLTVTPAAAETINGAASLVLQKWQSATIWTDGTNWRAVLGNDGVNQPVAVWDSGTTRSMKARATDTYCILDAPGAPDPTGNNDSTTALQTMLAEGVQCEITPGIFEISDTLRIANIGQRVFGHGKGSTIIRNLTTSDRLLDIGDLTDDNGYAERAVVEHLHVMGNALTTGGVTIYNRDTSGNPNWGNACRDVSLRDIMVSEVGAGWALDCRAWELEGYGITLGENLLKGARFGEEAQACRIYGLYITDCAEEGISIGAATIANNIQIYGCVVQQCGGSEGVVVFHSGEGNLIHGLYSEANNSKGAPCIVNIKDGASASIIGGSHKSGGGVVFKANGQEMAIENFKSSNVTGNVVEVSNTNASGIIRNIGWIEGVTPTGGKVNFSSSNYLNSNVIWQDGKTVYGGWKVRAYTPYVDWIDETPSATDFRAVVDNETFTLQHNRSGSFTSAFYFNSAATTPELAIAGITRPVGDNVYSSGAAASRWSVVYAASGTINTSDEREKDFIRDLKEAERRVALRLKQLVKAYKWRDAVERKGGGARLHFGWIAQEVVAAFEAEDLDPFAYGCVCYDSWEAQPEVRDKLGALIEPAHEAGDRFGVRMEQLLALILAAG